MSGRVPYRPGLIRSTAGSGLVCFSTQDARAWRHLYRTLRRAGVSAWDARFAVWRLGFVSTGAVYVSVALEAGAA